MTKFPLKIAVISDLHVGPGGRLPDFNPFSGGPVTIDAFKREFTEFVTRETLSADLLLVPGDITDRGHPDEYRHAAELVRFVAMSLGVPDEKIVIGLGNHDSSWALSKALQPETTGLSAKLRFAPISDNDWFRQKVSINGSLIEPPYFTIVQQKDAFFVCYNSACWDDHDKAPHHGIAVEDYLAQLTTQLGAIVIPDNVPRIFVTHHHPIIYSDPRPDQPDFSAMANAERLLQLARDHKFDILVHGHKHSPRFGVHIKDNSHPLAILCAGSFSKVLDTSWAGVVANQFHLLAIDGRDPTTNQLFGSLRNWALRLGRWEDSDRKYQGISHTCNFGYTVLTETIRAQMKVSLSDQLQRNGYLKRSDFWSVEPRLHYAPIPWLVELLRLLAKDWNCTLVGIIDDHAPPTNFMLVKT